MASCYSALFVAILFCLSHVRAEVEDLQPLVKSTEQALQGAKTHVEHMLNLNPIPNHEKIPPVVKNETEHLAYEIKKLATALQEKVAVGEHKPELKEAVTTASTHLNEAAATLEHPGSDLKEENTKYFNAAEKVLHEVKNILAAGPCSEIVPTLKNGLTELEHDCNNYQYGIHDLIGPHEGGTSAAGHKTSEHHHEHVHPHHGGSSEESSEEKSSSTHHHHHH